MQISFMTANYVARELNYHMDKGWGQGDATINAHFKPLKTFGERFEAYLKDIQDMGFEALDIWTAILNPAWATDDHLDTAAELLDEYNLPVMSLAGSFGNNADELEAACLMASALNTSILGGSTAMLSKDRPLLVSMLQKYGLQLGLENHPDEKTPQELLNKIGTRDADTLGVTVDTGWFGTHGYDAAQALEALAPRLFHVHLKDVLQVGEHETCRFGEGVVPIRACVEVLQRIGYTGAISVEHEPNLADPTEDVKANLEMLKAWLESI